MSEHGRELHKEIQKYIPTVEAIVSLFYPFVEAAIHDLTKGEVVALYNNISKRKIGDPSPLHELHTPIDQFPDWFDPYYKTNWDGRQLKCTSITVRDEKGKAIGLICFNFDTSVFHDFQSQLTTLLQTKQSAENPVELFKDGWQGKVDQFIDVYLRSHSLAKNRLGSEEKRELVQYLYDHGVFNFKNAANYVADQLHISRASVYNYLKG